MRTYMKPETEIVLLTAQAVMQGVTETSGGQGPPVNHDPIDPTPGGELTNHTSLWDEEDENE